MVSNRSVRNVTDGDVQIVLGRILRAHVVAISTAIPGETKTLSDLLGDASKSRVET